MRKIIIQILSILLISSMLLCAVSCSKDKGNDLPDTGAESKDTTNDTTDSEDTGTKPDDEDPDDEDPDDEDPDDDTSLNMTAKGLYSGNPAVRIIGDRNRTASNCLYLDYTGSGFEVALNTNSEKLTFPIVGSSSFRIFVDGVAWKNAEGGYVHVPARGNFVQITGVSKGEHIIRVIKADNNDDTATISSVVFDGMLMDTITSTPKEKYVEFIGDGSLMNGSDVAEMFPYMTAETLGADYQIFAWKTAKAETAAVDYGYRSPWDTETRKEYTKTRDANAIVLSIGANDTISPDDFANVYSSLIRTLSKKNGRKVKIYCVYDGEHPYKDKISDVCANLGGEAAGVFAVDLSGKSETERATALSVLISSTIDHETVQMGSSGVGTVVPWNNGVAVPPIKYEIFSILENKNCFNVMGRDMYTSSGVAADWSASGIEFYTEHFGAVYVSGKANKTVQFRVYVNGKETGVISFGISGGEVELPGTKATRMQRDHIRLARIEYVKDGLAEISNVRLLGTLEDYNEDKIFIEFIGDSITCGYGSVSNDSKKDGTRTFAYLTAEELDADYSMVAISGIGVQASTGQHSGKCMVDFYKYTNYYRNKTELYTPQKKADLIVVNLNTNDAGQGATEAEYKEKLKALLDDIHSIHGDDVKIVWIIGQMTASTNKVNGWLADVVEELGGEQSAGIYIMKTAKNNSGGGGHPNYESHKTTSGDLLSFIKSKGLL